MPPRDQQIMEYLSDALGAIRERLARIEGDIAYLKRKARKGRPSALSSSLAEVKPLWPYLVALALIASGHMAVDDFGPMLRKALERWLGI